MIRDATTNDIPQLLQLMRQLAAFERYLDRFAVEEHTLLNKGFARDTAAEFRAIVAAHDSKLVGYAVWYAVPFTFDLRPTIAIKELFVLPESRCAGIGSRLFRAVQERGYSLNARLLRWQVLPDNLRAMQFYQRLGGKQDNAWQQWEMELQA